MPESFDQVQRAFTAYTVERELGSGGMAVVYLAHDQKHGRKVAIKILHAELAAMLGAERFLHEIRITANLQHPHILGLIDSGVIEKDAGELADRPYYVMPFVEGESLRQTLDREQQLPVSDAVRIAAEVASALDYAHRRGVIHRDIKPENILLPDGSAVVMDFGIALALSEAGGERITQSGMSLGTPSYMSPEQAAGERSITARSDIYSLGAVTYEMLSGEPPFTGPTVRGIVARIMSEQPRLLTTVRHNVPPNVALAVSHALEKIPADRFATAHEFAGALSNPAFTASLPSQPRGPFRSRARLTPILYGAGALAGLLLITALWGWMRPTRIRPVLRYGLTFDSAEAIVEGGSYLTRLALSPDGSHLAYLGGPQSRLFIRERSQLHGVAVAGTEGCSSPFFSPDGQRIGILGRTQLRLVSTSGGQPVVVTDTLVGEAGASWGADDVIYADGEGLTSLLRVDAKPGAKPQWFTALDTAIGEVDHLWPDALPNGKGVLFSVQIHGRNSEKGKRKWAIAVADAQSGKHRLLIDDAKYARYSNSGHLLYVTTRGTLMVAPFDQNSMKITGEAIPLSQGLRLGDLGSVDLAVSADGTLVYGTGGGPGTYEFGWVTRAGRFTPIDSTWRGLFWSPAISPDGKQIAVDDGNNVWIKPLDRRSPVRFTFEGTDNAAGAWTPDGKSVTFVANSARAHEILTKRVDGSTQAVLDYRESQPVFGMRWSPDGKWLVFLTDRPSGQWDIFGGRPGLDSLAVPLVATKFNDRAAAISPDGRFMAYTSDESGQIEVYVVPFPNTRAAKWAVSNGPGTEPLWSHSGRELFYRDGAGNLVSVAVTTTPIFSAGPATILFPAAGYKADELTSGYAVSADDRRFLMMRPVLAPSPEKLVVVENWFEELKATPRK